MRTIIFTSNFVRHSLTSTLFSDKPPSPPQARRSTPGRPGQRARPATGSRETSQPGQRAHPGSPNPESLWITGEIPDGPEQLGSHRLKPQSGAALCSRRPGSGPTASGKDKPAALTPVPSTLGIPSGHMGPGGASRRGRGPGAEPWESATEPIRSEGITM